MTAPVNPGLPGSRDAAPFDPASVAIRPAATVMLVRDVEPDVEGAPDIEVFMLRRTTKAAFAGGMYVFPGGAVDLADGSDAVSALCEGLTDDEASRRLGVADGGLAYWIAAIRECFEEAGVLLARTPDDHTVRFDTPEVQDRFEALRHHVHDGTVGIVEMCADEGLRLATDAIGYVAHWVTPYGEVRRFDTRFFVAAAPPDQEPLHDDNETVDSLWVRPSHALQRAHAGELLMLPPTIASLEFLAEHRTTRDALVAAGLIGTPPRIVPKVVFDDAGRMTDLLMPGDPGYDALPDR